MSLHTWFSLLPNSAMLLRKMKLLMQALGTVEIVEELLWGESFPVSFFARGSPSRAPGRRSNGLNQPLDHPNRPLGRPTFLPRSLHPSWLLVQDKEKSSCVLSFQTLGALRVSPPLFLPQFRRLLSLLSAPFVRTSEKSSPISPMFPRHPFL